MRPSKMSSLFAKVAFYPTLTYTYLMTKVSSRRWYDRVDETVLIGALPMKWVIKQLVTDENVKAMVSVTEDFETKQVGLTIQELQSLGVDHLQLSTVDYVGTPSQDNIVTAINFISDHKRQGHSVYVHCKAGRTRSATVVACYLCHANGWTPEESVKFIKSKRPHVWLRDKQWNSVRQFYLSLKPSTV
ncbi:phosphatidylglycerophosphatase and protein-tyrosine phosphatase 1-like isoform X2 [Gigantopelta aegis]|uniref:phosphatidylglycerophosphatase and protein-tyrosine phosphatase 1-like isoform X2 n=1 Tax=Gigantopelta aegis TaxID=1735272 RepID=UPI001B88D37F|nr:phosphatidylglycerophosphatase and protein-tyrosine phosphatase 1-like isoform X2 [Gigantopelta aegis]